MPLSLNPILNSPIMGYAHHRIILDEAGKPFDYEFLEVNRTFEKLTGLKQENLIGRTVRQAIPGIEKAAFDWIGYYGQIALECREKEFSQYSEALHRWYRVHVYSTEKMFFTTMFIDITEHKQAEDLQKTLMDISNTFINVPLEKTDDVINEALATLGNFTDTDRAYVIMYDYEKRIARNTYEWCRDGISPQIDNLQNVPLEEMSDWVEAHKEGKSIHIYDVLMLDPKNSVRKILEPQKIKSLIVLPMMDNGTCTGFVGFDSVREYHDYSEKEQKLLELFGLMLVNLHNRNKMQCKLNQAVSLAEASSKAKSEFLAKMSHEIRTPLSGVIGFTDLLKNTILTPIQKQYVNNANISAHTLLGVINDILDFSKIEAGMMNLEIIKTDMVELLENSIDIVKFEASKKGLELLLNIDREMPRFALIDPTRLKQVFANLLSNAVKFTEKGEVELKVVYESLINSQGRFSFSVRDTGIGISNEQKDKLFKSFSQIDSSTTRKYGGTGLGLIISDMIVQKMGSKINFASRPHGGTTFFFDLEMKTEDAEKLDSTKIKKNKRCLILDDNASNRIILEQMLARWDVECESCENCMDGLNMIEKSKPFDVIICDYNMPYINGMETIRMIREKLKAEKQPIILIYSSSENEELHKNCDELGICFRLSKPVKEEALFHSLCDIHKTWENDRDIVEKKIQTEKVISCGSKILIAEDVEMNMMMIKAILKNLLPVSEFIEAKNGAEAVKQYMDEQPNLIFMDVQMPIKDGLDATKEIRLLEEKAGKHIPIIALTAGAFKEEQEKCLASGMDDFLTKPLNPKKIKEIANRFMA